MPRRPKSRPAIFSGVAAAVALAAVIGFLAVRGHAPVQEGSKPALPPARRPAASSTDTLPAAPDLEIVMYQGDAAVGGSDVRLSQLWGKGKPVVLNYFAGLCPPCRAELPDFQRLYSDSARDKFTLIGVDVGSFVGLGSRDDGKALLRELKITFPAGDADDSLYHRRWEDFEEVYGDADPRSDEHVRRRIVESVGRLLMQRRSPIGRV
jgi:thiol-disulfide isomerase/thioredoxin